jgi:hypothetical protein
MRLHCLVIALALSAAFASDSWGRSHRHRPSKGAQADESQTRSNMKGTLPFFIITDSKPTSGSQDTPHPTESGSADKERELQAVVDTAFWTKGLVIVGGATAIILFFQSVFLGWTVYLTRANLISAFRPKVGVRWFRFHNDQESSVKNAQGIERESKMGALRQLNLPESARLKGYSLQI